MDERTLAATRRSLHAVAELVIAGPQYADSGSIILRPIPGGIAGETSTVRIEGGELVWPGGRAALAGTCRALADAVGVAVGPPPVYHDGSGVDPDEQLVFDPEALDLLVEWFAVGDAALRAFAPSARRVLWPEHFDLAIDVDEVNYGVSPGDGYHGAPYAYVGPWTPREGEFWNAPFGAVRAATELADADAVAAFFVAGRSAAG
ncbi:MAG: hypothetical protein U0Q14_00390 [Dermatophilaceae bacterium]